MSKRISVKGFKNSFIVQTVFTSLISNLFVFGQPTQQMIMHFYSNKDNVNNSLFNIPAFTEEKGSPRSIPNKVEESKIYEVKKPIEKTVVAKEVIKKKKEPLVYEAVQKQGIIGKLTEFDTENIYDNFFNFKLPDTINLNKYTIELSYELYGLSSGSQTTKSINNHLSYGGGIIQPNKKWTIVKEFVPSNQLKKGDNELFFNRRADKSYQYKIRNLKLNLTEKAHEPILIKEKSIINFNGDILIAGVINDQEISELEIANKKININKGVFEAIITEAELKKAENKLKYKTKNGNLYVMPLSVYKNNETIEILTSSKDLYPNRIEFLLPDLRSSVQNYSSASLKASYPENNSPVNGKIYINGLSFKDLKPLPNEIVNVTQGEYLGYRIEKNNVSDSTQIQLHLPYSESKIPEGYTVRDVKTYYFDQLQKSWKALPIDSLDYTSKTLITSVTNDTDYINGIIKVPENPETSNFVPTAMSDIEFANPASGVVSISPPKANSSGSTSTSFPIKLPAGRNGMQPSLNVTYNSEAGNGWMGVGWNIHIPAISLNTKWGVPTFDLAHESEIYSLNGEDLVFDKNDNNSNSPEYTNPHREANIDRRNNRIFYLRKEGSFLKIERIGSNTTNYHWIVTDKFGNKSYYGKIPDTSSLIVLSDSDDNIAYWPLLRQEDFYGNYVDYNYNKSTSSHNGIDGVEIYISSITYTRHSSQSKYYQVKFNRLSSRPDVMTNARNGFMQITSNLLESIDIQLVHGIGTEEDIRSYDFTYKNTANTFQKSLLTKIEERDKSGDLFYSNTIEYFEYDTTHYDIVPSSSTSIWGGDSDNINSPLHDIASGGFLAFIPKGSSLGTSISSGKSVGARGGVGIGNNFFSTTNTAGYSKNRSDSKQNTRISFIDINGDGLSDKVYSNDNGVYYRPNDGSSFKNLVKISGIDQLSETKSITNGGGFDVNAFGAISAGTSWSETETTTNHYFNDFNGDGLIDLISDNKVLFNRTQDNADYSWRKFENTVTNTENIISPGIVESDIINDLELKDLDDLKAEYPQFDHVKVWKAPYTGTINISGNAEYKVQDNCDNPAEANEYKVSIERFMEGQTSNLATPLSNVTNTLSYSATGPNSVSMSSNIFVQKGEFLFFRVHNINYGCGGTVMWNPEISYSLNFNSDTVDENGKEYNVFNAEEDFIMNNGGFITSHISDSNVNINFNLLDQDFAPNQFSDDVEFTIEKITQYFDSGGQQINVSVGKWTRIYDPISGNFLNSDPNNFSQSVNSSSGSGTQKHHFRCYVKSTSNVKWEDLKWKPQITGTNLGTKIIPVNYQVYDHNANQTPYFFKPSQLVAPPSGVSLNGTDPLMQIEHDLFTKNINNLVSNSGLNDDDFPVEINWVTKQKVGNIKNVLYEKTFYLHKTSSSYQYRQTESVSSPIVNSSDLSYFSFELTKDKTVDIKADSNNRIYSAFYVSNHKFALNNPASVELDIHPSQQSNFPNYTAFLIDQPFFASPQTFFGISYRGWGQFLYNGGAKFNDNGGITHLGGPIDMSVFDKASQDSETIQDEIDNYDPEDNTNPDNNGNTTLFYSYYQQDNENDQYIEPSIYNASYGYSGNELVASTGRFAEKDLYTLYVDPSLFTSGNNGTQFFGLKQRTLSSGDAISGGAAFTNANSSNAESSVLNQYLDLNGDRYPDIVTRGKIQYSRMQGGLSNSIHSNDFVSGDENTDRTFGATISGMFSNSSDTDISGSDNKTNTNISAGINISEGESFNSRQWVDINGDGLADKIKITKTEVKAYLNTGYGFLQNPIIWGANYPSDLLVSTRENGSLGPSLPISKSFAAGFGGAKSVAKLKVALVDVNGDGLPDLVYRNLNAFQYYLNTGTKFSNTPFNFHGNAGDVDKNVTVSGNIFGSATVGFPLFTFFGITIKATATGTGGGNASFSETKATIGDIDGDGLPDVLQKENDNASVKAYLNDTGKTNLLKKVNLPLGGSWSVNYERKGNTYDMPQNKWVMNKVKTYDGFSGDDSFDEANSETLTKFQYKSGKYDRRDRSTYAFEEVITQQVDPTDNSVFRYTKSIYHNQDYYMNGMLKETSTHKDNGDILSKTQNFYNLLNPDNPGANSNVDLDNVYMQNPNALLDRTRLFPVVVKTISTTYEGSNNLSLVQEFEEYDKNGNLLSYINWGTGNNDAYKTTITYNDPLITGLPNPQFSGLPMSIEVNEHPASSSTFLRKREATYNGNGKLEMITIHLNSSETNRVQLDYDIYGNTVAVHQLDNFQQGGGGNPFVQNIVYEGTLNTYPIEFSDSFGQTSFVLYDFLFGIPVLTTDMNDNKMRTRIDDRGRVVEVTSPKEMGLTCNNWTIRNEYNSQVSSSLDADIANLTTTEYRINVNDSFLAINPGATQPDNRQHFALTRHNLADTHNNNTNCTNETDYNELKTLSIVDGLGQAIQVKKQHFMNGSSLGWQISGKETKDAFGRTIKSYLPTFENTLANLNYNITSNNIIPHTSISYDYRDRQKIITDPLNEDTNFIYGIDSGMFYTETTNAKGQTQKTFTDIRGRQRKTVQNSSITTQFYYNTVDELIKVKNTKGYETVYKYDKGGRRISELNPDRGLTTFKYNNVGNIIEKKTSNLMQPGPTAGEINYEYDYHRLVGISYPNNSINDVIYTYGDNTTGGNSIGRIYSQEDATGVQVFGYGNMGELTQQLRSIAVAGKKSYWFRTQWEYDAWNRIQKIIYPDEEEVTYHYDGSGQIKSIKSNISNYTTLPNTPPNILKDIISNIKYNQYGERQEITYGNGTSSVYTYDNLRRMDNLKHNFNSSTNTSRDYTYDELSNVTQINALFSPGNGNQLQLGGPAVHNYEYDSFNRLICATGNYEGFNDDGASTLSQNYILKMQYDESHNIVSKEQLHQMGNTNYLTCKDDIKSLDIDASEINGLTSYNLRYNEYASGTYSANNEGYVQPHAPREIIEKPIGFDKNPISTRINKKLLDYDANGNMTVVEQEISDSDNPLNNQKIKITQNLWDEENRLIGVDISPENPTTKPEIATYTYDASGERIIKYLPGRVDAYYSAQAAGSNQKLNPVVYPNSLVTAHIMPFPEGGLHPETIEGFKFTRYTKHYYMGSERISSALGTSNSLGALCEFLVGSVDNSLIVQMDTKVDAAGTAINDMYTTKFEKAAPNLGQIYYYAPQGYINNCSPHNQEGYDAYWYHPDHLGSSNYITNLGGNIIQHMEYLPFGETLVEEHLNSYNSPYKFNAKEFDAETGNYYYGARYYNPKWSIWLSVDPLSEMYPSYSPYSYVLQNPIRYTDPTGMVVNDCGLGCKLRKFFNGIIFPNKKQNPDGTVNKSRATGWDLQQKKSPNKKQRSREKAIGSLNLQGIVENSININAQINIQLNPRTTTTTTTGVSNIDPNSIVINNRLRNVAGPTNIDFDFGGNIGAITTRTARERITVNPLSNNTEINLQAVSNYLRSNPQSTVRFQYPTPPNTASGNATRTAYGMNFQQITDYLRDNGVSNPNARILMSYGTRFGVIARD